MSKALADAVQEVLDGQLRDSVHEGAVGDAAEGTQGRLVGAGKAKLGGGGADGSDFELAVEGGKEAAGGSGLPTQRKQGGAGEVAGLRNLDLDFFGEAVRSDGNAEVGKQLHGVAVGEQGQVGKPVLGAAGEGMLDIGVGTGDDYEVAQEHGAHCGLDERVATGVVRPKGFGTLQGHKRTPKRQSRGKDERRGMGCGMMPWS